MSVLPATTTPQRPARPAADALGLARSTVAVLLGGRSSERDVSLSSGRTVLEALGTPADGDGHGPGRVVGVEILADGRWRVGKRLFLPGEAAVALADVDLEFLALHGGEGENGALQGFLTVRDLAFTYDHESIRRAIQRFEGRRGDYTPRNPIEQEHAKQTVSPEGIRNAIVRDALKALAVRLGSMREGRKSVVFVSEGFPPGWLNDPRLLREITQEANRHNTSIYPLDPRGLVAGDGDVAGSIRPGCGSGPTGMRLRRSFQ